jgi:hypothetical protein
MTKEVTRYKVSKLCFQPSLHGRQGLRIVFFISPDKKRAEEQLRKAIASDPNSRPLMTVVC